MERKALLQQLLVDETKADVLFVGDLPAVANVFADLVSAGLQIEGVMAKLRACPL